MSYLKKMPLKQVPNFVNRTYVGGKLMMPFLGLCSPENSVDTARPEFWISSFIEAKNREYTPSEGISLVEADGVVRRITELVKPTDFGAGRDKSGVLVKLLDAGERLGIQVHPNKEFAKKVFKSEFGKTECWHILGTRVGKNASIYLGFKEFVTREFWRDLYEKQDVAGMLNAMHRYEVSVGDTILVTGGTPHAIGEGCFLLEIQEPSDYTMRVEKVTPAGEILTEMQLHYGAGEQNLLDCFDYTARTRDQVRSLFFLSDKSPTPAVETRHVSQVLTNYESNSTENPHITSGEIEQLVTHEDTPCFALSRLNGGKIDLCLESFCTLVVTENGGTLGYSDEKIPLKRGDVFFIPAALPLALDNAFALLCLPPKLEKSSQT